MNGKRSVGDVLNPLKNLVEPWQVKFFLKVVFFAEALRGVVVVCLFGLALRQTTTKLIEELNQMLTSPTKMYQPMPACCHFR